MAIVSAVGLLLIHVPFWVVVAVPSGDEISRLPAQPSKANFKQFGGYVTIDEKQGRALFYYFVQAQAQPDSKPLVLWLNGGKFIFLLAFLGCCFTLMGSGVICYF